jgi:hypothetical protein
VAGDDESLGAQTGGGYDLTWNVVGGGGGKTRDGTGLYSLRGTIGQPAVGVMSGGSYALTGGFWAVPAAKPGDINGDGKVNVVDLLYLADSFGMNEANTGFLPYDDLNDDGNVDVADLLILAPFLGT